MKTWTIIPILIFLSLSAHAFSLSDHKLILEQALKEYNQCAAEKLDSWQRFAILQADLEEDINLARKDLFFSHYYNPYKKLNMSRYDSSVRIQILQNRLHSSLDSNSWRKWRNLSTLGHIVHHLQDMAVPPHVVPVTHTSFTDGFESYSVEGDISSGWSCNAWLGAPQQSDPMTLLQNTAIQTLKNIANIKLNVQMSYPLANMALAVTGDHFWRMSLNNDFGQYGFIGNNYGQEKFVERGVTYTVPKSFYQQFKQDQMRLAVQSTLLAMRWYVAKAETTPPLISR